jgi:hypothetical protein
MIAYPSRNTLLLKAKAPQTQPSKSSDSSPHSTFFAEKIQDIHSKHLLISAFVEASQKKRTDGKSYYASPMEIRAVFNGTTEADPLREWLIDCYVYKAHNGWVAERSPESYHPEFMFAVMVGMIRERASPTNSEKVCNAAGYRAKLRSVDGDGDVKEADAL